MLLFLIPLLFLNTITARPPDVVDAFQRVDCAPIPGSTINECPDSCLWGPEDDKQHLNVPYCHFPSNTGYRVSNYEGGPSKGTYQLRQNQEGAKNPFGYDTENIRLEKEEIGAGIRLKVGHPDAFEPTLNYEKHPSIISSDKLTFRPLPGDPFTFVVERKSTGRKVWDTSIGGLVFGEKYIQIATKLPTKTIYGFGEHIHQTINHDFSKYKTWPLFSRDQPPQSNYENYMNLYGVHNFYVGIEPDGKAHGVFVLNSNAQEVTTGPGPHLVYRAIGGKFEIFFFPGPTPEEVIQQYQQVIGKPYLPAYWALGFQLCRYGYLSLRDMSDTLNRVLAAKIPIDTIIPDIDYMERYKDFTIGQDRWYNLPNFAKQLRKRGMHLTVILDPAVQVDNAIFERAKIMNASFIAWPRGDLVQHKINDIYQNTKGTWDMLAVVWPDKHVAFPDFYDDTNATERWWIEEIKDLNDRISFDGLWIDMNEPSAFGTNEKHPWYYDSPDHPNIEPLMCPTEGPDAHMDNPPYRTSAAYQYGKDYPLAGGTLCMLANVNRGKNKLFDLKNLYGLHEAISTYNALRESTGKRGQVISRSTFPGAGRFAGHWLGDNTARWEDLRTSVIGAQEFNMFGIPFVGSDVCGFLGTTNEELCLRWQQLGAFHSFYRNHNDIKSPAQDPAIWPSVAKAARIANEYRYLYLPYLYSLHFHVSEHGGTVIRPVAFEFPQDPKTHGLSFQFMWGPAVMVVPNVWPNTDIIGSYLPENSNWYTFYGSKYGTPIKGTNNIDAGKETPAPAFLREGYLLPRQVPGMNTEESRKNNLQLVAGLKGLSDDVHFARGELYWDEGDNDAYIHSNTAAGSRLYSHYHFKFNLTVTSTTSTLFITRAHKPIHGDINIPNIEEIEILGQPFGANLNTFTVNGQKVTVSKQESRYSPFTKILKIRRPGIGLINLNSNNGEDKNIWKITWEKQ
ncbi:unnamed protein product [Bursaphelenchus xylophilus]|uniref:(pine wood nematode) hypothetical protein n=1 Tax=Bursaphelenchus xylophilus TaxID=6326 RepID=A0A1I7RVH8_BURXY|nr:unnamed protein product [Bursaphelenchus xylophilus]CAG9081689.1 unnamed protein product [Bursaphelenchus xylophilus]